MIAVRPNVRAFVEAAVTAFAPQGPVYEFGAYQVPGQEAINNLRVLFPRSQYVGCDLRPGPGVDRIEDLANLSLEDNSVATILCLDTLEHVFVMELDAHEGIRVAALELNPLASEDRPLVEVHPVQVAYLEPLTHEVLRQSPAARVVQHPLDLARQVPAQSSPLGELEQFIVRQGRPEEIREP